MSDDFHARAFKVVLAVFPPIPMVQANAVAVASALTSRTAISDIHMGDEVWTYTQRSQAEREPRGRVKIQVKETEISIEHRFPLTGLERFETLLRHVFEAFESIGPDFVFSIEVDLTYDFDLRTDSRHALLSELGLISQDDQEDRVLKFGRPCYQVGLRLMFPPFEIVPDEDDAEVNDKPDTEESAESHPPDEGTLEDASMPPGLLPRSDWLAVATIQTLADDETKLSVELQGTWHGPTPWGTILETVEERLTETETYLKQQVREFLGLFQKDIEGDDDEDQD